MNSFSLSLSPLFSRHTRPVRGRAISYAIRAQLASCATTSICIRTSCPLPSQNVPLLHPNLSSFYFSPCVRAFTASLSPRVVSFARFSFRDLFRVFTRFPCHLCSAASLFLAVPRETLLFLHLVHFRGHPRTGSTDLRQFLLNPRSYCIQIGPRDTFSHLSPSCKRRCSPPVVHLVRVLCHESSLIKGTR